MPRSASIRAKRSMPANGRCRSPMAACPSAKCCKSGSLLQFLDPHIAEPDFGSVAAEADMAFVARQARMFLAVDRAARARLGDVGIDDRLAVQDDLDLLAAGDDLLAVPFTGRLESSGLGRLDAIDRPMMLPRLDVLVPVRGIVEHLNFHAFVGRIDARPAWLLGRHANADAIVRSRRQLELELEIKVAVFLHR